jgi:hypothetical protein
MTKLNLTIADENGNVLYAADTDDDVGVFLTLLDADVGVSEEVQEIIYAAADADIKKARGDELDILDVGDDIGDGLIPFTNS